MSSTPPPNLLDPTTLLSLLGTVAALGTAYALSRRLLPRRAPAALRVLYVWHVFDALVHACYEGSFLYNCFFVSAPRSSFDSTPGSTSGSASGSTPVPTPFEPLPPDIHWLADPTRLYGAFYGRGASSRLWQEYAKADRRWGGSDPGVVSLELLTVGVGAPLAAWCAEGVRRGAWRGAVQGTAWWWMTVLAVGELYGGWMTFCPEWLTGSPNLDTSNWMHTYLYLAFFNLLWVFFPLWVLVLAYRAVQGVGGDAGAAVQQGGKRRKKRV